MSDGTIVHGEVVHRDLAAPSVNASRSPFSWSAAIAGALAATAVACLVLALGSGIGLSFASPYFGASAAGLTIAAALWLVLAQTIGFAMGGYLAGRLRSPAHDGVSGETTFRDAAQGFIVWSIGVIAMGVIVGWIGFFAAGAGAQVASLTAAGTLVARELAASTAMSAATMDYFIDRMFRPAPAAGGGQAPGADASDITTVGATGAYPGLSSQTRAEVTRIIVRSIASGGLDDDDRTYLGQAVAARTGLAPDAAQGRVAEVENTARETAKEAAAAAKAGASLSFWLFLSLLFGGAAATLCGILGGKLRDAQLWRLAETE